jgi:hypothetical protein
MAVKTRKLNETVIIVAGGTGGIGGAICRLLSEDGAIVVAVSRTAKRCTPFPETASPGYMLVEADLSTPDAWNDIVRTVELKYGRVDVLINCVGTLVLGGILQLSDDNIRQVVEVNILSMVYGVRTVLPGMLRRGCGQIINIGSLGGIIPMPHEALYSATKAAVRALSMSLNEELHGTGIHVSMVSPGPVRTRMLDIEARDDRSTMAFVQKTLRPERVARAILNTIRRPRKETVIPRVTGMLTLVVSRFPSLFSACYPILDALGRIGLERYRRIRAGYPTTSTVEC